MSIRFPEPHSAARILCREAAEAGISIKYTQALGLYAKMLGFRSYNAMQPLLDAQGKLPLARPEDSGLDARETATVLAALRYWQREGWRSEGHEHEIASGKGSLEPLTSQELDSLCERLSQPSLKEKAPPAASPKTVVVAIYEHPHGQDIGVYRSVEDAYRWMEDIADEWWEHELSGEDKPQDRQQAAQEYFERVEDESFTVHEHGPVE